MKSLLVLTLLLLLTSLSDSLRCTCSDCGVGEDCSGDHCYFRVAKTSIELDAEVERVRGCISSGSNIQCNTSSSSHTTLCCNHGDYCNENLTAELGQTQGTPFLPTSQPDSEFTIAPILIPGSRDITVSHSSAPSSTPTPAPTLIISFPSITPNPSCFRYSSDVSDVVEVCPLTSFCYSSLRRMMNGDIVSRRGCSVGLCEEETRNRKVKRCCASHMCNIELSIDEFFPDQVTTTLTPDSITTTTTEVVSERPHIPPPILTPLPTSTEAAGMVTSEPDNQIYCYCNGSDCIRGTLCKPNHACATEFTVTNGSVSHLRRLCVDDQSKCGITEPNKYISCCTSMFCNQNPRYEEIPSELFAPPLPPTITDESTTPTLSNTSHPADNDLLFLVLTIALSILAVLLLVFIVAALVTCYVQHRRRRTLQLSKKHVVASVNNHPNGCHDNVYDDTSRASVQSSEMSTTSNQTTPSKEHLMTSV